MFKYGYALISKLPRFKQLVGLYKDDSLVSTLSDSILYVLSPSVVVTQDYLVSQVFTLS